MCLDVGGITSLESFVSLLNDSKELKYLELVLVEIIYIAVSFMYLSRSSCSIIQRLLSSSDFKCINLRLFPDSAFLSLSLWYYNFDYPAGLSIAIGLNYSAICSTLLGNCLLIRNLASLRKTLADWNDTASAYWFCTTACFINPCSILFLILRIDLGSNLCIKPDTN